MLHLGRLHDDALYLVAGKSIADGRGPLIPSLPGAPAQTKYPPLLPLFLAGLWKLDPELGQRPVLATALAWSFVPLLLLALLRLYRAWAIPPLNRWGLVAFLALSGYLAVFGSTIQSELLFTALCASAFLAVDRALDRPGIRWWLIAGVCGSLAVLTRTAGIVLLVAVPVGVWLIRRHWRGLWFSLTMLPTVIAWLAWTRVYRSSGSDHTTAYYTDYVRDLLWNATPANYHLILGSNLGSFVTSLGNLLIPEPDGFVSQTVVVWAGVWALWGSWRFCRTHPHAVPFGVFALLSSGLLIAWPYSPVQRLVFPVFPLVLAGALHEAWRFSATLRKAAGKQPVAARVLAASGLALLAFASAKHVRLWWEVVPGYFAQQRRIAAADEACFVRIRAEIPPDATFAAYNDPVLWMRTGRRAIRPMYRTALWYEDRREELLRFYQNMPEFARARGLGYIFLNSAQPGELTGVEMDRLTQAFDRDRTLVPRIACGTTRIWQVLR